MFEILDSKKGPSTLQPFKPCTSKLVLIFDMALEQSDHVVNEKLSDFITDYSKWETMKYGTDQDEVTLTFLRIVELTEKAKQSAPVFAGLVKYQLKPKKIWTVYFFFQTLNRRFLRYCFEGGCQNTIPGVKLPLK